jgi:hypothetical protein
MCKQSNCGKEKHRIAQATAANDRDAAGAILCPQSGDLRSKTQPIGFGEHLAGKHGFSLIQQAKS